MHIYRNSKTILRIMKKHDLLSKVRHRRKWRQIGQQIHKYDDQKITVSVKKANHQNYDGLPYGILFLFCF